MNWIKQMSMSKGHEEVVREQWIREESDKIERFDVDIYLGKKTDLLSLKKDIVNSIKKKQDYYNKTRKEIYNPDNLEIVEACPVCNHTSDDTRFEVNIYGAEYNSCNNCSHVYVKKRPRKSVINGFYLNDITYAATYTNKEAAESRLNSIAVPWLEWTIKVYKDVYGRAPKRILDVGSGAGHFVEACRRKGIEANGIELSESSRKFSREIWGIELDDRDFVTLANDYSGYDIVTFWGLLEHTPNPRSILNKAYQIVSKSDAGMVISKVPRWNSLSSAIQRIKVDTIIRHLDPMGHIMCFTDQSTAEIYFNCGFAPSAAWYYGMDVYETLMQFGARIDNYQVLTDSGDIQVDLQQYVDENRFSDGLTLAGIPI